MLAPSAVRFGQRGYASNPVGVLSALAALALSGLGIAGAVAGRRLRRDYGRLRCADDIPVIGVPNEYNGDYWEERGRRRYYEARAAGAVTEEGIAAAIIGLELRDGPDTGLLAQCLAEFPPSFATHPRNAQLWDGLLAAVRREMDRERAG